MKKCPVQARKTKVLACGTFDLLHPGHEFFLREAEKLGTELIVLIAQDNNVQKIKNKIPRESVLLRQEKVAKLEYVDKVVLGDLDDFGKVLKEIKPDILAVGYDQVIPEQIKSLLDKIKICKIPAYKPEIYKTTLLSQDAKSK